MFATSVSGERLRIKDASFLESIWQPTAMGGWLKKSPAGWLPVHRNPLRAQRSVTGVGELYLFYNEIWTTLMSLFLWQVRSVWYTADILWLLCSVYPIHFQLLVPGMDREIRIPTSQSCRQTSGYKLKHWPYMGIIFQELSWMEVFTGKLEVDIGPD